MSPRLIKKDFQRWLKNDRLDCGVDEDIIGMFESFLEYYFDGIHEHVQEMSTTEIKHKRNGIFTIVFGWQDCVEEFEVRVPVWMRDMIKQPPKFYITMEE